MNQPSEELERANWEITAAALPCDYISDLITVRVTRDWVADCGWYLKYKSDRSKGSKQKPEKGGKGKIDKCVGPDCPIVTKYRGKLIEEEFGRKQEGASV